jgi:hypothetical protein
LKVTNKSKSCSEYFEEAVRDGLAGLLLLLYGLLGDAWGAYFGKAF